MVRQTLASPHLPALAHTRFFAGTLLKEFHAGTLLKEFHIHVFVVLHSSWLVCFPCFHTPE
jgi:hypothetical protein